MLFDISSKSVKKLEGIEPKRVIIAALSIIIIMGFFSAIPCFAADDAYDKYTERRELINKLCVEGYKQYGLKLRMGAIAEACGDKALFSQLMPPNLEVSQFVVNQINIIISIGSSSESRYLKSLTSDEIMMLVDTIDRQLRMYGMGYNEAMELFMEQHKEDCQSLLLEGYRMLNKK